MTTKTNTFTFAGLELRSATIEGKPHFIAGDVFRAIGLAKGSTTSALQSLPAGDVLPLPAGIFSGKGMAQAKLITEAGLYRIVMRSQKGRPQAAEFQTWVTDTVLPAIRQDGMYVQGEEKLDLTNPLHQDKMLVTLLQGLQTRIAAAEASRAAAEAVADVKVAATASERRAHFLDLSTSLTVTPGAPRCGGLLVPLLSTSLTVTPGALDEPFPPPDKSFSVTFTPTIIASI